MLFEIKQTNQNERINNDVFSALANVLNKYNHPKFKKIVFDLIHSPEAVPYSSKIDEDTIYILSYSIPRKREMLNEWDNIKIGRKRIKLKDGQRDALVPIQPTEKDKKIIKYIKDDDGDPIGEVIYNMAYIYFDFTHTNNKIEEILTYILDKATPHLDFFKGDISKILFKQLEEVFKKQYTTRLNNLKKSVDSGEKNIKDWCKAVMNETRNVTNWRNELEVLTKNKDSFSAKVKSKIANIKNLHGIDRLKYCADGIMVITKPMTLIINDKKWIEKYKIKKIKVGRYAIKIKVVNNNELEYKLTFIEITPYDFHIKRGVRDGAERDFPHPHIEDNKICWGNMGYVSQLLASGEYDSVIAMTIQFLEKCNPADPYIKVDKWVKLLDKNCKVIK